MRFKRSAALSLLLGLQGYGGLGEPLLACCLIRDTLEPVYHWLTFLVTGPQHIRVRDRGGMEDPTLPGRPFVADHVGVLTGPFGVLAEFFDPQADLVLERGLHQGVVGCREAGAHGESAGNRLGRVGTGAPNGGALACRLIE